MLIFILVGVGLVNLVVRRLFSLCFVWCCMVGLLDWRLGRVVEIFVVCCSYFRIVGFSGGRLLRGMVMLLFFCVGCVVVL